MSVWPWIFFLAAVLTLLAIDLGVFHRKDEAVSARQALGWTAVWIGISLAFAVAVHFMYEHHWLGIGSDSNLDGHDAAIEFLTGYVIEKSLSLDNIFVIALIFRYFKVPDQYQHRILFWGILGALVMRGVMIVAGAALLQRFTWMTYVFGGILIVTAIRMLRSSNEEMDPEKNAFARVARRFFRVAEGEGHDFFTRVDGHRAITPLFLALLVVESSDVLFAVDSIPAIFAVTDDPYIVFTSNIFAILGLRSLYFAVAVLLERFRYVKQSLVFVLGYVGVKMIVSRSFHIPAWVSLVVIGAILSIGVIASLARARSPKH